MYLKKTKKEIKKDPEIKSFKIMKDKTAGYKVLLNWDYGLDSSIVGFRIYRAVVPKSLLKKNYVISQKTLESLTATKSNRSFSQILYDKNYFVENNKVKFNQDHESRFRVKNSVPKNLNYKKVSFIKTNTSGVYNYEDPSIKFGETYSYIISAVSQNLHEFFLKNGQYVNVEEFSLPKNLDFDVKEMSNAILVSLTPSKEEIHGYKVYRRIFGENDFKLIFSGTSSGSSMFLDSAVIPGNEYEYKVYVYDMFGNMNLSSEIKRVEFKSQILNKGAVIDPIARISFRSPNIVIEGKRNNDRIIGYRVERQDLWMNEKGFSFKTYNDFTWPNVIMFDESGRFEMIDETAKPGRAYKYRISSISKMATVESIIVTPPIDPAENPLVESLGFSIEKGNVPHIESFEVDPLDTKQDPFYLSFSWKISGNWDYFYLVSQKDRIKIDNIHDSVILEHDKNFKSLTFKIEVYFKNKIVAVSDSVRVIL